MKILITGGAGFIGSHIAERYYEQHEVHIVDNFSTGSYRNIPFIKNENIYNFDVQNNKLMSALINQEQYEIIIHLAAVVSVVDTIEQPHYSNKVNLDATLNILETIKNNLNNFRKFIFASSAAVYGNDPILPKQVSSNVKPESPYAIQKYGSEQYSVLYNKLYGVPTTALRFFNIYGPRQNPTSSYSGVISILNKSFQENREFTFFGDGKQTRDFLFVKDLVEAIDLVLNNPETNGKVYNLGTGKPTSLLEIFDELKTIYDKNIDYKFVDERKGDIKYSYADISEITKLGFKPKFNIAEGLKEYVNNSN